MNSLLRLPAVMDMTGLRRSTLYLRIRQGLMPSPVKLGERCAAWPAHEIAEVNAARVAGKPESEIRAIVARLTRRRVAAA